MMARPSLHVAPAALWGLAVALILLAAPVGFVETLVASSGLSEALPAAAPPLGLKARLLLALFGALMAAGVAWAGRDQGPENGREQEDGRRKGTPGVKIMGFALSKLSWLARGRGTGASRGSRPSLRRADAHPDAPARAPIFASRDFDGLDIFPRVSNLRRPGPVEALEPDQPAILPRLAAPPQGEDAMDAEFQEIAEPVAAAAHAPHEAPPAEASPGTPLSIAELTERLERGLASRSRAPRPAASPVLADMPVERPVPVRDRVEDEADQALRAALTTLRAMADRTR